MKAWHAPIRRDMLLACILTLSACAAPGGEREVSLPPMPMVAHGVPDDEPDSAQELVRFVRQAAGQVQRSGRSALATFGASDSPWQFRDTYIFVLDGEGQALYYDSAPHLVGQDLTPFTDTSGRPFVQWQLEALNNESGTAWAFYRWPRPQAIEPAWVASFAQRVAGPDNQMYLVGAARYELEPHIALLRALSATAAAQLQQDSTMAMRDVRDPQGPLVYRDAHVVVLDEAGRIVASPQAKTPALPDAVKRWVHAGDAADEQQSWSSAANGNDDDAVRRQIHGRRVRVGDHIYFVLAVRPLD